MLLKHNRLAGLLAGLFVTGALFFTVVLSANAQTVSTSTQADLQKKINNLLSLIASLRSQLAAIQSGSSASSVPVGFSFTRTLRVGSSGNDVLYLQRILNIGPETRIANSGPGSPGQETQYFGQLTRQAVMKFQELNRSEILAPSGLAVPTGLVGPATRTKLNYIIAGLRAVPPAGSPATTTSATPTVTAAFSSLMPATTTVHVGASRIPFLRLTLSAGTGTPATVYNITVQKNGTATGSLASEVVLLDSSGSQVGSSKSLDSLNQATIGDTIALQAGEEKMFTVAAMIASTTPLHVGKTIGFSVVSVNAPTGTQIRGSFPIVGPLLVIQ